jgi:integrase
LQKICLFFACFLSLNPVVLRRKNEIRGTVEQTTGGRKMKRKGYLFQRGKKKTWYIQLVVDGQTIIKSTGKTSKREAEKFRAEFIRPYALGDTRDTLANIAGKLAATEADLAAVEAEQNPPPGLLRGWGLFAKSARGKDLGQRTLAQYEGHWKRFMRWAAKHRPKIETLADVSPAVAFEYANDLNAANLSANRYNKHVSFLRLFFRVLRKAQVVKKPLNPFAEVERRKLKTHNRKEFTVSDLLKLLDRSEGEFSRLIHLGACTGLRLGDCCLLDWKEVDILRRVIIRVPNKTAKNEIPVKVGIPDRLQSKLLEIPPEARTGYVLPTFAADYLRDPPRVTNRVRDFFLDCGIDVHAPGTGKRIKRGPDGQPERDEGGKVKTEDTGKPAVVDCGFHSLRHTWVSLHAAHGTPGAVIQDSVGHANPSMTAHYTHIQADTARDVALALPAFKMPETAVKALPASGGTNAPPTPPASVLGEIRRLAKGQNSKTWKMNRDAILALCEKLLSADGGKV